MLSIEIYRKIYNLLDKVNPLSYDCGKSCGAVCCRNPQSPCAPDLVYNIAVDIIKQTEAA